MKMLKAFQKHPVELMTKINNQQARIKELEDELNLEKTWAEGEIDFWKEECAKLEAKLAVKNKPFWRHIIS